ncbi:MAG: Uncharacterised protein [Polaribacter sp. SA4-10]|nr:MAG: Uncharacterised protein [Polaribacter sp. SA4-10]|tara:strand:- start:224 stop:433 length:210 start_codon:yes stop_codon:yes gene_type:complete
MKSIILKWYPVILAFLCLLYSVTYGLLGITAEADSSAQAEWFAAAQYSAHWPGTILLFAIAIRQRRNTK